MRRDLVSYSVFRFSLCISLFFSMLLVTICFHSIKRFVIHLNFLWTVFFFSRIHSNTCGDGKLWKNPKNFFLLMGKQFTSVINSSDKTHSERKKKIRVSTVQWLDVEHFGGTFWFQYTHNRRESWMVFLWIYHSLKDELVHFAVFFVNLSSSPIVQKIPGKAKKPMTF